MLHQNASFQTGYLFAALAFIAAACSDPAESSRPGPGGTGGIAPNTGGAATGGSATGSTPGTGALSGSGGTAQTGGAPSTGGVAATGGSGTGGESSAYPPPLSEDPEVVDLLAAHDVACLAACEVALECVTYFSDLQDCLNVFFCTALDVRVNTAYDVRVPREKILGCLQAAGPHMSCVGALDCPGFLTWWNEEPTPFACSTEQYAEEAACAGTGMF